jgi:hypothetical protein
VSPGTRFDASEENATNLPPAENAGCELSPPIPWAPVEPTDTREVVLVHRSRTNTSASPFVSPRTRFDACDTKATNLPPGDNAVSKLLTLSGWAPVELTDTLVVAPVRRSRTNTSTSPSVSPGTRLEAYEANATNLPSAETAGDSLPAFACAPVELTDTRVVVPLATAARSNTHPDAEDGLTPEISSAATPAAAHAAVRPRGMTSHLRSIDPGRTSSPR